VVLPAFRQVYEDIEYRYPGAREGTVGVPYTSAKCDLMDQAEIRAYLETHAILDALAS
jgi:hypothetical protein